MIKNNKRDRRKQELKAYYESTRRVDGNEPTWILPPFDKLYAGKRFEDNPGLGTNNIELIDNFPWGPRMLQGGFIVGSSSWVFMHRKESPIIRVGHAFATCRQLDRRLLDFASEHGFPYFKEFWCIWALDDDGWLIYDRNPTDDKNVILEMADNPERYGIH